MRDHNLPDIRPEPSVERMVEARDRDRVKGGCYKVRKDELKSAWPRLFPGDMVRGQHPKTKEWSLKGEVLEMVHGDRAVNMDLDEGEPRLLARDAVRKDTTRAYQEQEEEELRSQLAGMVGEDRPEADLEQLEESRNAGMRGVRERSSTWRRWSQGGASGWPRRRSRWEARGQWTTPRCCPTTWRP